MKKKAPVKRRVNVDSMVYMLNSKFKSIIRSQRPSYLTRKKLETEFAYLINEVQREAPCMASANTTKANMFLDNIEPEPAR